MINQAEDVQQRVSNSYINTLTLSVDRCSNKPALSVDVIQRSRAQLDILVVKTDILSTTQTQHQCCNV
uniref:Uncharacterized protein n=1 Tax=Arundo donax TaxID=35708 RepID=A0A0A9AVV3_ARUDO